jgi:hypothetical protein
MHPAEQPHQPDAVTIRPLTKNNLTLLQTWLTTTHVRRWWRSQPTTLTEIEAKYGLRIDGTAPTQVFIIQIHHRPIGIIQSYRHQRDRGSATSWQPGISSRPGESRLHPHRRTPTQLRRPVRRRPERDLRPEPTRLRQLSPFTSRTPQAGIRTVAIFDSARENRQPHRR